MTEPATFTATEKYHEVMRELRLRQHVYARLVAKGGLAQADAARQIDIIKSIAADYRALAEREPLPLFETAGKP